VLDVVAEKGLQWDHRTHSGVVFHMVSAIAVGGHVGLTAIDRTPAMAARMFGARSRRSTRRRRTKTGR
jgi:hypothetical protein